MKNLLLLIVAWLLMKLVLTVAFWYTTIKQIFKAVMFLDIRYWYELTEYWYRCALSLDISGAVIGQHLFNDWWIKPDGDRFTGKSGRTISNYLKTNSEKNTWYPFGAFFGWALNKIDKGHLDKSKV